MNNDTHAPPAATERTSVPENALMGSRLTDTDPGAVLLEVDMFGDDNRHLVIAMSGTVREVRADLDTLLATLEGASRRLAEREVQAQHGIGGF